MDYAKMPLSLFRDSRLLKNDLRVLAVLIFRSNKFGKCWPSLTDIAEQSGLRYSRISGHTKRLKEFGYIDKKLMKKGTNNLLIYTVFSQVICQEVYPVSGETIYPVSGETIYPVSGETIYPVSGETTPIYIKPITLNIEKDATVSSKRLSVFSIDEILQIKIPEILSQETGFIPAWESWVKTKANQKQKKNRWTDVSQVEKCLDNLAVWFDEGLDIVEGLETATDREWIGFRKQYFNLIANTRKPKLSKSEEIDKAFDDFERKFNGKNNSSPNAGNPQNFGGDVLELSSERIHDQSVGVGVKRLLA
jgi:DNA-binding transcriptional ArsR family regulator